jgi:predicted AlkP superfamily pyrophosphatase or phosphodiesterase
VRTPRRFNPAVAVVATLTAAAAAVLATSAQSRAPKLIVLLVVDQMRGDYVERFQHEWTGGFHRLLTEGARFTRADYPYFNTVTCAGHATISTGTYPSVHGMIEDGWFDRAKGTNIECTDDDATTVVSYGSPVKGPGNSAARMRVPALAEVLRSELQPRARVASFALKARSAAIMAGKRADAIAWFYDSNTWTTSTAYSSAPVPAVANYIGHHPWAADSRFVTRPEADKYVAEMAAAVSEELKLGETTSTDFLAIGFSVLDFVGHEFGPSSWQVGQVLLGLDRTLGNLLTWLDLVVGAGNYTVALSSDHGVAPLPEQAQKQGLDAGRTSVGDMVDAVNRALAPSLGKGQFVRGFVAGDIYISAAVWSRVKGDAATIARLKAELGKVDGVGRVYVADELQANRFDADPIGRSLALGFDRERSGDIEVAVKPYWIIAPAGASHGSRHEYDARVPLILMGKGIKPGEYVAPASPADIAPTLAYLAGVKLPKAQGRVLTEAIK